MMLLSEIMETELERFEKTEKYISQEKIDGDRVRIIIGNILGKRKVTIINRHENNYSLNFPEIIAGLGIKKEALNKGKIIIDGEIAYLNPETKIFDHNKITARQHTINSRKIQILRFRFPVKFYAFDLISYGGIDMVNNPDYTYEKRYNILKQIVINNNVTELLQIRYDLTKHFKEICKIGNEGIVVKQLDNIYINGRSNSILKCKNWKYEEIKFEGYEDCPSGIVLTNNKDRVLCADSKQAEIIRATIMQMGYSYEVIRHLQNRTENGALREPSWKSKAKYLNRCRGD